MNYYPLLVDGKEYRFRIRTRDHARLEKWIGGSVMEVLQNQNSLLDFKTIAAFLAVGGGLDQSQAYDLIDELVDSGKSLEDLVNVVMEICEVSGFFPRGTVAQALQEQQQQTPTAPVPEEQANP